MDNIKILENLAIEVRYSSPKTYIGSIYILLNMVNQKVYVGQTVQSLNKRLCRHKSNANLGCTEPIYNAIRKYGWNNFKYYVVYQTQEVDDREIISKELDDKEKYYISYFNSTNNKYGYNILLGGAGRTGSINNSSSIEILQFTIEGDFVKEWPSMHEVERQLGYSHKSISYFNYGNPRKSSYKGFLWIKKSQYYDGIFDDYHPCCKAVSCYNIKGEFLQDFESQVEASKFYNINISQISNCCLGKILTTKDLIFIFSEDSIEERIELIQKNSKILTRINNRHNTEDRRILQYSIFGELLGEYNNSEEASKFCNVRKSDINKVAKGLKNTEFGSIWIFEDEYSEEVLKNRIEIINKHQPSLGKLLKKYYNNKKFQPVGICVRDYE